MCQQAHLLQHAQHGHAHTAVTCAIDTHTTHTCTTDRVTSHVLAGACGYPAARGCHGTVPWQCVHAVCGGSPACENACGRDVCVQGCVCAQGEPMCDHTSHVRSHAPQACASLHMPLHVNMPVGYRWLCVPSMPCACPSAPRAECARACPCVQHARVCAVRSRVCVCHT